MKGKVSRKKVVIKMPEPKPKLTRVRLEVNRECEFHLPDLRTKFEGFVQRIEPLSNGKWLVEVQQSVSF